MAETQKRKASLIVNLIILIGFGFAALTAIQVASLSNLAKKNKLLGKLGKKGKQEETEEEIEEIKEEATTKYCPFCFSEININATRCPHCTSKLDEEE